jgi:hypothetical protein
MRPGGAARSEASPFVTGVAFRGPSNTGGLQHSRLTITSHRPVVHYRTRSSRPPLRELFHGDSLLWEGTTLRAARIRAAGVCWRCIRIREHFSLPDSRTGGLEIDMSSEADAAHLAPIGDTRQVPVLDFSTWSRGIRPLARRLRECPSPGG